MTKPEEKRIKDICIYPLPADEVTKYGQFGMEVVFENGKVLKIHPLTPEEIGKNVRNFAEQHMFGHVVTKDHNGLQRYKPSEERESVLI